MLTSAFPPKPAANWKICAAYAARPAVATERLSVLPDGRVLYHLRHPWRSGATHVVFEPLEFVAKLAALVPPPMFNLVRYHGLLSPAARWRSAIVPFAAEADPVRHDGSAPYTHFDHHKEARNICILCKSGIAGPKQQIKGRRPDSYQPGAAPRLKGTAVN